MNSVLNYELWIKTENLVAQEPDPFVISANAQNAGQEELQSLVYLQVVNLERETVVTCNFKLPVTQCLEHSVNH